MNYKKAIWLYLIKNGYIVEQESYYGSISNIEKTLSVREMTDDIDWGKTSEVTDGYEDRFAGTFVGAETVGFLSGDLVMNSGDTYKFKMGLDNCWSFTECVKSVLSSLGIK